ncbi:MAG: hypothetical protein V2A77_08160 [Pseudomonadota bacterium]
MRHLIKAGLVALLLSVNLTVPAAAGQLEDAEAAFLQKDYATAVRLWRPLADQGDAKAQSRLGYMYDEGQGVPRDYVQAHKWYSIAAVCFAISDAEEFDLALENRKDLAAKMTPAQIAEAQRLACEWRPNGGKKARDPEKVK